MSFHKIVASGIVAVSLFGASIASAQVYYPPTTYTYGTTYPTPTYQAPYSAGCVNLVSDLSYGSQGAQVSQLQTFLVSQNFPGAGSWMITGNFRSATMQAVRNFQQSQGLPLTGAVDASTRAAISHVSCGGTSGYNYNNNYTAPPSYNSPYAQGYGGTQYNNTYSTNCYYTYPYTCTNINNSYNYNNNYNPNCGYSQNNSSYGYGYYGQNTYGGQYPYGYNYCPPNAGVLSLSYLNPNSGKIGSTISIYGDGFSRSGNTVHFGGNIITGLSSTDGHRLRFDVPDQLVGYLPQGVIAGTYNVSVTNSSGQTSNALPFTVTSGSGEAPSITSVSGPTLLDTGEQVSWKVKVKNRNSSYVTTSVIWGDENIYPAPHVAPQTSYAQGTDTLTFTHTYYRPGTYTVVFTVSNGFGQQDTSSKTVTVGFGTNGNVTLSSIQPMSGRVGTQIMLLGSGFNALDNTVRFGIGGTQHVPSFNNGTTIYYTIPSYVAQCDLVTPGSVCTQNIQQVLPGPIQVSVSNTSGTTNAILFQVQ